MSKNFAVIGVGGYIAPRHLKAIYDTGNKLVAALDPHDSVGRLDAYDMNISYFKEYERFDRHLEKLRRKGDDQRVHYVSICSPNYLHDAHVRTALRVGAEAICEKPLVLNPWNIDALEILQNETGKKIYSILQLRLHPSLIELKKQIDLERKNDKYDIELTYITSRGLWYGISWKGATEQSGGIATNIGIHFFDMLIWLFGGVEKSEVHLSEAKRSAGYLELEKARVRWFLSIDASDLPDVRVDAGQRTYRSIKIDGSDIEFTDGFTDLHTLVYKDILDGYGFGLDLVRPSIDLAYNIRNAEAIGIKKDSHPMLR